MHATAPAVDLPPPRMALRHLMSWGDGLASAKDVIEHMSDSVKDGEVQHPMVHRLAGAQGLGSRGLTALLSECGIAAPIAEIPGGLLATHFVRPSSLPQLKMSIRLV